MRKWCCLNVSDFEIMIVEKSVFWWLFLFIALLLFCFFRFRENASKSFKKLMDLQYPSFTVEDFFENVCILNFDCSTYYQT